MPLGLNRQAWSVKDAPRRKGKLRGKGVEVELPCLPRRGAFWPDRADYSELVVLWIARVSSQ